MNRLDLRVLTVAIIAPFAIAVTGVALILAWLPDLPATVGVHWGVDGTVDGFAPSWFPALTLGITGLALPALLGGILIANPAPRRAGAPLGRKLIAVVSLFVATVLSIALTGSVAQQRFLTHAADAPNILPLLIVAFAIALVVSVVAWFVMPKTRAPELPAGTTPAPLHVAVGERAVWIGHTRFATWAIVVLAASLVLVTGLAVFAIAYAGVWGIAIAPLLVGVGVVTTSSWRVRVDAAGLTTRSSLGWPTFRVPLAEVASATVTTVTPLSDFGGYGIRYGLGRTTGVIMRRGEAIEVRRRDGRGLVVTVDDAATAAALLTALAAKP